MAMLPLKLSRNEQYVVIRFLWAKGLNANEHIEVSPVYGDKCFTRPAIHVWCTKFAHSRESIVDKKRPGWHVVDMTDVVIAAADAFVDRWDRWLPVWVPGLRIDPHRLLAGCRKRQLNQAPLNLRGLI